MSTIQVEGFRSLKGEIEIQGSKNAVLPMMAAAILHRGTTVITNVPGIQDVFCMMGILEYMGCVCTFQNNRLTIDARNLTKTSIPEHYVKTMRSSIMILGALLGRCNQAVTHYPGGCSIGKRPIDMHLYALECLGAEIEEDRVHEMISARTCGLHGGVVKLPYPSVGATENALLAAVLAEGVTTIGGAAREPEIQELCRFLNHMGAEITGGGTDVITIRGTRELKDSAYHAAGDRIVAGTYLAAAAAAGGEITIKGIDTSHMEAVLEEFEHMGLNLQRRENSIKAVMEGRPHGRLIRTGPYPGFPTDLQSLMMAVMSTSDGAGILEENVFEGRYETAKEMKKLGADIRIEDKYAYITGTYPLRGNDVNALDLRGGAALVVAGLASEGITRIHQCHHILRGYEDICRDLSMLGASVSYLQEEIKEVYPILI